MATNRLPRVGNSDRFSMQRCPACGQSLDSDNPSERVEHLMHEHDPDDFGGEAGVE